MNPLGSVASIRRPLALALLCFALISSGCRPASDTEPVAGAPDRVRVVTLPFLTLTPVYIAAEEGYFEKYNLDVEFVQLSSIQGVMTALARGEVDASGGMLTINLMNTIAQGLRVRMVSALGVLPGDACSTHGFVMRRELSEAGAMSDPEQLRGLRFDADIILPHGYWADVMLAPLGLTIADFDVNNLPEPASGEALRQGSVDIAAVGEPYLSMALASGEAVLWRAGGDLVPDYPVSVVMYGPTLLDERPEVGERLAAALLEAARDFSAGKTARNRELVAEYTGLTPEQIDQVCFPTVPHDARADASLFRGYQEWAVAHDLSDRVLSDAELVDSRFMDSANAALAQ